MSTDIITLRRLAIRVADELPLPDLVESYGRRMELSDFLSGLDRVRSDVPPSVALLLGREALTVKEAVALIREHHAANT